MWFQEGRLEQQAYIKQSSLLTTSLPIMQPICLCRAKWAIINMGSKCRKAAISTANRHLNKLIQQLYLILIKHWPEYHWNSLGHDDVLHSSGNASSLQLLYQVVLRLRFISSFHIVCEVWLGLIIWFGLFGLIIWYRLFHCLTFIYKALIVLLPSYLMIYVN